jgi:hypothetical protein
MLLKNLLALISAYRIMEACGGCVRRVKGSPIELDLSGRTETSRVHTVVTYVTVIKEVPCVYPSQIPKFLCFLCPSQVPHHPIEVFFFFFFVIFTVF